MDANKPTFGSHAWVEEVFSTPAVIQLEGPSKATQFHDLPTNGPRMGGQGRKEAAAILACNYMQTLGLVKRFKAQPFETPKESFGAAIRPDLLVELHHNSIAVVIEVKTERFLTRIVHTKLDYNRTQFEKHGLNYLVWTDSRPLNHAVRHHLFHMARFARQVPADEVASIVSIVSGRLRIRLDELLLSGVDLGALYAAAALGRVFFPVTKALAADSWISVERTDELESAFLGAVRRVDEWWTSL